MLGSAEPPSRPPHPSDGAAARGHPSCGIGSCCSSGQGQEVLGGHQSISPHLLQPTAQGDPNLLGVLDPNTFARELVWLGGAGTPP